MRWLLYRDKMSLKSTPVHQLPHYTNQTGMTTIPTKRVWPLYQPNGCDHYTEVSLYSTQEMKIKWRTPPLSARRSLHRNLRLSITRLLEVVRGLNWAVFTRGCGLQSCTFSLVDNNPHCTPILANNCVRVKSCKTLYSGKHVDKPSLAC